MLEGGYWSLLDPARARPPMWAPCVIFAQKEEPVCARRPPNQNEESRSNNFELGINFSRPEHRRYSADRVEEFAASSAMRSAAAAS